MTKDMKGKVALVTGSSRGIGRAVACELAERGARLIGIHFVGNANAARDTVERIEHLGSKGIALSADLSTGKAGADHLWRSFASVVADEIGESAIDILVNNAGGGFSKAFETVSDEDLNRTLALNFAAPFFLIQAALPAFRSGGRVVNISTAATRIATSDSAAYAAAKGALETMTLSLAPLMGARNITINAVMPGLTATDVHQELIADPQRRRAIENMSVFNRIGLPEDIAAIACFLASDAAAWITGRTIDASGGTRL
jgi:3-oxoacyl-[acyl-carrier protein] reductase